MRDTVTPAIRRLLAQKTGIKLDLGCGDRKHGPDWVGMDVRPLAGVDIVHDLEVVPWPLPDNCVHTVAMSHIYEHVKPWCILGTMAELHRVCQPEAQIFISGPYGLDFHYVQDPTHCNPVNEATFAYWDDRQLLWNVYKPPVFHTISFERVPVGEGIDFAAVLQVCKPEAGRRCIHV